MIPQRDKHNHYSVSCVCVCIHAFVCVCVCVRLYEVLKQKYAGSEPSEVEWQAGMFCAAYINGVWERAQLCSAVPSSSMAEVQYTPTIHNTHNTLYTQYISHTQFKIYTHIHNTHTIRYTKMYKSTIRHE